MISTTQCEEAIKGYIEPDEQVIWTGRPDPGVHLYWFDYPLSIIGLIIAGGQIRSLAELPHVSGHVLVFLLISCLPDLVLMLAGLYLAVGRVIYRHLKKLHTCYAVTDRRMIEVYFGMTEYPRIWYRTRRPRPGLMQCGGGLGTIFLDIGVSVWRMIGIEALLPQTRQRQAVTFIDIPDVLQVWAELLELTRNRVAQPIPPEIALIPPAPRRVPARIALAVLLGNILVRPGWIVFSVAMLLFWRTALRSDPVSYVIFQLPTGSATGTITSVHWAGCYRTGGSWSSIYSYDYRFRTANGQDYSGTCYTSYRYRGISERDAEYAPGDRVAVRYLLRWPSVSGVTGLSRELGNRGGATAFLPLIGLLVLALGGWMAVSEIRVLRNGKPAIGEVQVRRRDGIAEPEYRISFRSDEGYYGETSEFSPSPYKERKHREDEWLVVYDPLEPRRAVALDFLPACASLGSTGKMKSDNPILAAMADPSDIRSVMIAIEAVANPALFVGVHSVYLTSLLFRPLDWVLWLLLIPAVPVIVRPIWRRCTGVRRSK